MYIMTIAKNMDMTYGFFVKLIMCALEWKLNAMTN